MSDEPLHHDPKQLGKALRNPKKRSAVFIVIVVSIGVHVLGLGIFGVIKIVETISPPPEFEAPPIVEMDTPPPPPPPPPPKMTQRSQKSLPRPQPLAAQNPQNMSVPSIVMQESDMSFGRGTGGGFGDLGGGIMDRVDLDISFFGMEGGNNVVVLFDRTGSGRGIFERTREELFKTIDSMTSSSDARLAVIFFGGKQGGNYGINRSGKDPTDFDYWWPKGIRRDSWIYPSRGDADALISELNEVRIETPNAKGIKAVESGNAYFIVGTNYWGALKTAYNLQPQPDTVYLMAEPKVAFPSVKIVEAAYAVWEKYGVVRPEGTKVVFVVGKPEENVRNKEALNLMVNLINGGDLSKQEIRDLIVY